MDKIQELELRIEEYKKTVKQQEREIDDLKARLNHYQYLNQTHEKYRDLIEKVVLNTDNGLY